VIVKFVHEFGLEIETNKFLCIANSASSSLGMTDYVGVNREGRGSQ